MKVLSFAAVLVSSLFGMASPRLLSLPILLGAWILCIAMNRARHLKPQCYVLLAGICLLIMVSSLSPVDIGFTNRPGPPHLAPLVMGLPDGELIERAERGEIVLGGCVIAGNLPKYILVW